MPLSETIRKGFNYQRVAELHSLGKRDITISQMLGISRERVRQIRVAHGLEKRPRWYGEKRVCKVCGLSFEARGVAYSEQRCVVHSLLEKPCDDCGAEFRGRFYTKSCIACRRKQYQQKLRNASKNTQWLKEQTYSD